MNIFPLSYSRHFIVTCLLLLCFTIHFASAQNSTSSPYSRYGIGDLTTGAYARSLSLGGSQIGLNLPGTINFGNPAFYGVQRFTTYEFGVDYIQYFQNTKTTEHKTNTGSFAYFDFAFPVKPQKWSLGFGLLPYSRVGYSVSEEHTSPFGNREIRTYEGSGGLNDFHIGSGYRMSKKLSLGINAEYLFGVINSDRTIGFSAPGNYGSKVSSGTSIGWFHFTAGALFTFDSLSFAKSDSLKMLEEQISGYKDSLKSLIQAKATNVSGDSASVLYSRKNELAQKIASAKLAIENLEVKRVKSEWNLVLGAVLSPTADLHARNSMLAHSFRYQFSNPDFDEINRDTTLNVSGQKGTVRLPMRIGIGFSLFRGNKWLICGDYSFQQWDDYFFLGQKDSLVNSWKATAGVQLVPNERSIGSYFLKMQYRLGLHYEQTYLKLNGKNINDMGVSMGFGLPIRSAGTLLNFTFEGGQRGTIQNDLIRERYLRITFGVIINDLWFQKPKYD